MSLVERLLGIQPILLGTNRAPGALEATFLSVWSKRMQTKQKEKARQEPLRDFDFAAFDIKTNGEREREGERERGREREREREGEREKEREREKEKTCKKKQWRRKR